ncbi:MAG: hypothetical protein ABI193_20025 [Minicystis sp.]
MPRASLLVAALLLSFSSLPGCARREDALERDAVLHALDALRDAPSTDLPRRRGLLHALEHTAATRPEVVRARDTCVAAYRPLLDGTELQEGIRTELAKADPAPTLIARLLEAEAKIKQSATVMPDCERAIVALRIPGGAH